MRIPAGVIAVRVAFVVSVLCVAAAVATLLALLLSPPLLGALRTLAENAWWFRYNEPASGSAAALFRIGAAAAAALIAGAAAFRGLSLFRKGGSPIAPFIVLFLFSLSLECLRAGMALLYAMDGSIAAGVFLTRVVYWGRFAGLLALLIASLYCVDMKYRRFGVLIAVDFLVSFAITAYIPIDRTIFLAQLTWKLGDEQGVWFVNIAIGVLIVLTGLLGAATRRDPRMLIVAGGFLLLLAAREVLFFAGSVALLAGGLGALVAGITLVLGALSVFYRAGPASAA
ncbi:MAG TPA: hypothetical protein VHE79_11685 [Spirochaetia bacterium]